MNKKEFMQLYWKSYILLEKEFVQTLTYVSLEEDNYNTFSPAYIKILLQIGSEVDIVAKELCKHYNSHIKLKNINDYRKVIMESISDFCNTKVNILNRDDLPSFSPWDKWEYLSADGKVKHPSWWTVYNMVKHRRTDTGEIDGIAKQYYKFANLKHTLYALGGLYQLLIYLYYNLTNDEPARVPVPGSHLFELSGNKWDDVIFHQDIVFKLNEVTGNLSYHTGEFTY